jgi:hypothetical protein
MNSRLQAGACSYPARPVAAYGCMTAIPRLPAAAGRGALGCAAAGRGLSAAGSRRPEFCEFCEFCEA